ncbi:TIGR03089 family protein [Actinotalea sp. C106]|uniref:TIGR03089 family protein n=1 Tax=Actinotalea sp. C106 TaxID=2908644 RepID=UPI0020298A8A|nr:TIGR03089 family protein [Actinotalea sp. C106]
MISPTTVPGLLQSLAADAGRPRLTWYGPEGERIELSGHVLDNWVTKTANLLAEEFGAGPSHRVLVDLPPHWRTVVWALAVWRVGAHLVLGEDESADLVVTDQPQAHADAVELVAVALPALARRFDGTLPAGAIDAASAVMTYGDMLTWMPEAVPTAPALTVGEGSPVPHGELLAWARPTAGTPGRRVLVEVAGAGAAEVLREVMKVYADDGSVVLWATDPNEPADQVAARRERVEETERVTG